MKPLVAVFTLLSLVVLSSSPGWADDIGGVYIASPDHPSTWAAGADVTHQSLRWSSSKQMLIADVTFNDADYCDGNGQRDEDYTLSFPSVHLDSKTGHLVAHGVVIGTLEDGSDVALNKNLELNIRLLHHGMISAVISTDWDE